MDVESHDGEDFLSTASQQLDLSQSSGVMSLPSGNKLANISITSDITDSELENEETVLDSSTQSKMKTDLHFTRERGTAVSTAAAASAPSRSSTPPRSTDIDDRKPNVKDTYRDYMHNDRVPVSTTDSSSLKANNANMQMMPGVSYSTVPVVEHEEPFTVTSLSLDDVRFALQKNCNLLSDRHLLNDLLKSLDEEIGHDSAACTSSSIFASQKYPKYFVPPNRDPGPSLGCKSSNKANVGIMTQNAATSDSSYVQLTHDPYYVQNYKSSSCYNPASSIPGTSSSQGHLTNDNLRYIQQDSQRPQAGSNNEGDHDNLEIIPHQVSNDVFSSHLFKFATTTPFIEELGCDKNPERHVQFQHTPAEVNPSSISTTDKCVPSQLQTASLMESKKCDIKVNTVLKQLSGLRWRLLGWEDVGASPPENGRSSLAFVHQLLNMLQVHQLEKKHLEDEVLTTKALLKKMSDEAHIRQSMYEKRETRLLEADKQLGIIQKEWVEAQEAIQMEMKQLTAQCSHLKEERDILKDKVIAMEGNIDKLTQTVRDYEKMKIALEETRDQCVASRKQTSEMAEENLILNQCLQEKQRYLEELEEVHLPQIQQELKRVESKANGFEEAHDKLKRINAHLEDDLHVLQEQHRILLKKVVDEEEMKEKALKENASLEEQMKDLSSQVAATRNELHHHYQAQLEEMMGKKSRTLQEQLNKLEINMKRNLEEQLDAQRKSHYHACLNLQKEHEKQIKEIKSSNATQLLELQQRLKMLEEENVKLKDQRQGIVTAVSSILGLQPEDTHNTHVLSSKIQGKHHEEASNNLRCKLLNRPASGAGSRGKMFSQGGSRPASGKSASGVPHLGLGNSSSSDSDASMFQEGRQTVRPLHGGSLCTLPGNLNADIVSKGKLWNSRSENMAGYLESDHCNGNLHINNSDREYRSLPDLQSKSSLKDNYTGKIAGNGKSRGATTYGGARTRHGSISHQEVPQESIHPSYSKKIFMASEIIQASDYTDEDGGEAQANIEMERIFQKCKMMKTIAKEAPGIEAPTHDTFIDEDPASITLQKLNQVSTLLSQYVSQS
nr:uncharacterized protein LOC123753955 isoform X1 [Procambarus clarkii]XP_045591928.1 uncharacterized protein LOC123753955 isoform X1 [Procambarus clarkii]